jgi:hypothetical protein
LRARSAGQPLGVTRPPRTIEEGFSLAADGGDGCEDGVDRGRKMGHHDTCDPAVSVIVEPARSAMLRCVAGGMTRSSVPITAQLGMVFQAAFSVPAVLAPSVIGR